MVQSLEINMLVRQLINVLKEYNPEAFITVGVNGKYEFRIKDVNNKGHYTVLEIESIPE